MVINRGSTQTHDGITRFPDRQSHALDAAPTGRRPLGPPSRCMGPSDYIDLKLKACGGVVYFIIQLLHNVSLIAQGSNPGRSGETGSRFDNPSTSLRAGPFDFVQGSAL